jgi:thiol-disulfide isomerase/thioredoxin
LTEPGLRHAALTTAARPRIIAALALILILVGCGPASSPSDVPGWISPEAPAAATVAPSDGPEAAVVGATEAPSAASVRPEWFGMEMTDVLTGQTFTINDFAGKVVLLETMAVWCPTCRQQGDEVVRLHELLGDPTDLVSISLDTDMGEDAALLKKYAETLGYDWNIALAPLLVARALGNLYSAQYLNPPVSPMLVIDRDGQVLGLPLGLKSAESLQGVVEPLLGG